MKTLGYWVYWLLACFGFQQVVVTDYHLMSTYTSGWLWLVGSLVVLATWPEPKETDDDE